LKLKYDDPLSNSALNFNLRRYTGAHAATPDAMEEVFGSPWRKPSGSGGGGGEGGEDIGRDSARFVRQAMAGSAEVVLPLELARHSTPAGLLRAGPSTGSLPVCS
jgi:hypothetical protein